MGVDDFIFSSYGLASFFGGDYFHREESSPGVVQFRIHSVEEVYSVRNSVVGKIRIPLVEVIFVEASILRVVLFSYLLSLVRMDMVLVPYGLFRIDC